MPDLPPSSLDNAKSYFEEYGRLKSLVKDAEARMKELDELVRPALTGRGATVIGKFMFKLTESPGRKTLDKEALLADGVDVEKYYKVGKPFTTLKIEEVDN